VLGTIAINEVVCSLLVGKWIIRSARKEALYSGRGVDLPLFAPPH